MKKLLRWLLTWPLQKLISSPFFRYSIVGGIYHNLYTERERMLATAMKYAGVSGFSGDYFEFGVWRGNTFIAAYYAAKHFFPSANFYAFDSFEGLPEVKAPEGIYEPFKKGQFAASEDEFRNNLVAKGVDMSRVHIVAGWYDKTLTAETREKLPAKTASVVYIDCDLYESAKTVLEFITSYLGDGSLILFDDWFSYRGNPARGEQKAFKEWLKNHPELAASEYQKFGWSGNSFIVHCGQKP